MGNIFPSLLPPNQLFFYGTTIQDTAEDGVLEDELFDDVNKGELPSKYCHSHILTGSFIFLQEKPLRIFGWIVRSILEDLLP